jgi:hypothetical protein
MKLTQWIGVAVLAAVLGVLAVQLRSNHDVLTPIAERYVKLVLALGQHDPDYVDAYYGPPEWRREAEAHKRPLDDIDADAQALHAMLARTPMPEAADELTQLRQQYLKRQLEALGARVAMLNGTKLDFDQESKALYDAVAPMHAEAEFQQVLDELDRRLPGTGPLVARYDAFRSRYIIPKERLDAVFKAAIDGCRERTLRHMTLPAGERFTVEYVTNKSWGGYNWYQGNYHSLIQVNTDLPIYVDRAIDLACHEGYPGHHVYNALLEKHLVHDRGWPEFRVYALFSPQSLIAEGTATYGVDVAFPGAERIEFERRVIFPAAGIDPAGAEAYYEVKELVDRLTYATNEAARRYINGDVDAAGAAAWLERFGMYSPPRAARQVKFIEQYRSYVINYNLGKDMIARHIEAETGGSADPDRQWEAFARLLSSPRLPSGLASPPDIPAHSDAEGPQ